MANGSVTMLTFFEDEEDGFLEDFRTETGVSWLECATMSQMGGGKLVLLEGG